MYSEEKLYAFLEDFEIDLSFFDITTKIKKGAPVTDVEVALEKVLRAVKIIKEILRFQRKKPWRWQR